MLKFVKGDYGVSVIRTIRNENGDAVDISGASTRQFLLRSPDGTVSTKSASFTTTGADGKIQYVLASGDIASAGGWKMQFKLTDGATLQIGTPEENFEVLEALA